MELTNKYFVMHWRYSVVVLTLLCSGGSPALIHRSAPTERHSNRSEPDPAGINTLDSDLMPDDARNSANFFSSELGGGSYAPPPDYGTDGFFDHFPDLSYFPEFGEIFRISRTTTPAPPFRFPAYVRDAFSDGPSSSGSVRAFSGDSTGGRRPSRRPPRPASSGTRTKITKQGEPKEKPRSPKSHKHHPTKSRSFPKIFRFTSDRVNLADFDMKKKVNENYLTLTKGDELDSDKVKRNEFLILHGGVFEIEPSGRSGHLASGSESHPVYTSLPVEYASEKRKKRNIPHDPYVFSA